MNQTNKKTRLNLHIEFGLNCTHFPIKSFSVHYNTIKYRIGWDLIYEPGGRSMSKKKQKGGKVMPYEITEDTYLGQWRV